MTSRSFNELFSVKKLIIGMIHLAGRSSQEKLNRALEELDLYQSAGVDGAIIEDYYGRESDVYDVLKLSSAMGFKIVRGVNLLRNPYKGFILAKKFGAKFVQFDSVQTPDLDLVLYDSMRATYPEIQVLGGVGFKYTPKTGNRLEDDLVAGKSRCEAIVTTGPGTGIETPIEKLKQYKQLLGNFPLIDGAGVNLSNVREQMMVADGAIIGSYFKRNGNAKQNVEKHRPKNLMSVMGDLRAHL